MGDRVSIRFTKGYNTDAPVIFSHWGGVGFVNAAISYAKDLVDENLAIRTLTPLDRLEPRTVTCDFIFNIGKYYYLDSSHTHRIDGDIYLGKDEYDGDNSENGHFNIELDNDSLAKLWERITGN